MALRQRDESLAADWVRFRELTTTGKFEEALRRAEQVAAESTDPFQVAQALIELLFAYHAADLDGDADAAFRAADAALFAAKRMHRTARRSE